VELATNGQVNKSPVNSREGSNTRETVHETNAPPPPGANLEGNNIKHIEESLLVAHSSVNRDMFQRFEQKRRLGYLKEPMDKHDTHYAELAKLLVDAGAPLKLFDKISDWALSAKVAGVLDKKHKTRQRLLDDISCHAGTKNMKPILTHLTLPNAKVVIPVTTFDATEVIMSLLLDQELVTADNLLFFKRGSIFDPPESDFSKGIPPGHVFGDVYTGHITNMAYHCRVENRGHEMVIPLIFFLDKTHIDAHGHLMQEPLCMTLGCFDRKTWMNPWAWRILGYIPNQSAHVMAKDPRDKLEDYHFVLQHVLQSLSEFQSKGPFYWEFPRNAVKDETQRCSGYFYTFFANLQGDIPGHDAACGHFNSVVGMSSMSATNATPLMKNWQTHSMSHSY
jgi:hypothetical protein